MDIEPEVARQQMEDTRASLTEKLETLEQHVVDTVEDATSAVSDTVGNVKDAVTDTVENIKDALNLRLQVKRHPWGAMVGSVALGYLGGYLLHGRRSARPTTNGGRNESASPDTLRMTTHPNGVANGHRSMEEPLRREPVAVETPSRSEPGWLSGVTTQFGPEIAKLKGMVIGSALGVLRDLIIQSAAERLKPELAKVMDSITTKLGGEPTEIPESKGASGGRHPSFSRRS
jgi:hypothetical protein